MLSREVAAVYVGCMTLSLKQLMRAIPVAVAAVGVAEEAHAAEAISCGGAASGYYDPCSLLDGWVDLTLESSGPIPSDGVLVLQGAYQGGGPAFDALTLTVTTNGMELPGVFETTFDPGVIVWRPSMPWMTGATYQISGGATNEGADGECIPLELPISGEVTIDAEAGAALKAVEVTAMVSVSQAATIDLAKFACCEGSAPSLIGGGCGGETAVQFDPTKCAPLEETGSFELSVMGTSAAAGPVEQQVFYNHILNGTIISQGAAPNFAVGGLQETTCVRVDAIDVGNGSKVDGVPGCFGDEVLDQLGPHAVVPDLACEPVVCEVNEFGDGWDTTQCVPFGGGGGPTSGPTGSGGEESGVGSEGEGGQEGEKGCGCDSSGSGTPGLALLALVGVLGRRRRS